MDTDSRISGHAVGTGAAIVGTATSRSAPRYFGSVRMLPSGRYQARYSGPDGKRYPAQRADGGPLTFETKGDAEAWLSLRQSEVLRNEWLPPAAPKAARWLWAPSQTRGWRTGICSRGI